MDQSKKHLDIDLDFLDKKTSKEEGLVRNDDRVKENSLKSRLSKSFSRLKLPGLSSRIRLSGPVIKKILIIGGILIFLGWLIFSGDDSSTTTNTNITVPQNLNQNQSDTIVVGEYRCSQYHYDQAVALTPDETEQQINTTADNLLLRSYELDRLKREIDNSYVTEYSPQYEINQYNAKVNEYNSKLASYNRDQVSYDARVNKYNTQVEIHNNYLENNCTRNR